MLPEPLPWQPTYLAVITMIFYTANTRKALIEYVFKYYSDEAQLAQLSCLLFFFAQNNKACVEESVLQMAVT